MSKNNSGAVEIHDLDSVSSSSSSSSSSSKSSSIEIIYQGKPPGPSALNFGNNFKLPNINSSNPPVPAGVFETNKSSVGRVTGEFGTSNSKAPFDHAESFSSIDSKPSIKMRPDSNFAFSIPNKQPNIPKNLAKTPSMKYGDKKKSSSSSSSSSSRSLSESSEKESDKAPKPPKSPVGKSAKPSIPVLPPGAPQNAIPKLELNVKTNAKNIDNKTDEHKKSSEGHSAALDSTPKGSVTFGRNQASLPLAPGFEIKGNAEVKAQKPHNVPPLALPKTSDSENKHSKEPKIIENDPQSHIKIQGPGEIKGRVDINSDEASVLDQSSFISESKDEFSEDLFNVEGKVRSPKMQAKGHEKKHEDHGSKRKHDENGSKRKHEKEEKDQDKVLTMNIHGIGEDHENIHIEGNHKHKDITDDGKKQVDHNEIGVRFQLPDSRESDRHHTGSSVSDRQPHDINMNLEESCNHPFMFSSRMLSFGQLAADLSLTPRIMKSLWLSNSCMKFCSCFFKGTELTDSQEQNVFRIINLGTSKFNNENEFHRNILMSYYVRYYNKTVFEDIPNMWATLGFSSTNKETNELFNNYMLLTAMHLVFMYENCVSISRNFVLKANSQPSFPFLPILLNLMKNSIQILRNKKFNSIFAENSNDSFVFQVFFEYQSGVVAQWNELYNDLKNFEEANKRTFTAANRNPQLMRVIYQNAKN